MAYLDTDSLEDEKETPQEELLEKAKKCFKLAQESEARQRQRERDDLRFQVPELQWDEAARRERQGGVISGVPTPARPILSISKLDQPIQLIMNQARAARLGVNIHPVSEDADKEGAEIRQGLYRRIERDSNADQARLWALDRATKAGRGAYRVNTKWDEDAPPETFDQEIVIERILHQESVYFDPSSTKADFSDGEWAFVTAWVPIARFRREFPNARVSQTQDDFEWETLYQQSPNWVRTEDDEKALLVAEYWYKVHKYETIKVGKRKREKDIVSIRVAKITGMEVLEEEDWNGKYIPIIPVVGRELQPFDSERRWVGIIGPAKDSQRAVNYAASSAIERVGLEPKAPFIGAEGQFEGHESEWQQANTRNFPYLEYKPTTLGDKPVAPPARSTIDQSGLSLSMQLLQEADHWVQSSTAIYDPSLGRDNPRDKSGKAILALQQQSDAGTSHFLSSLADVSMPLEARIILDLMPAIYDRPGRVTTILRGDDSKSEAIMLNQPYVKDQQTGRPVAPPQMMPGMPPPQGVKEYDLSKGNYAVSVDIGKSFQTRLQQGADEMGQILSTEPSLLPLLGDLYFRFRDFPGAPEIADRLAKLREKQYPGLDEGEQGQQDPQQAQAKMQAMEQQLQQMQQQLQAAGQQIQTDQAKQQAQVQTAQINAEKDIQLQRMRDATSIAVAQINAQAKGAQMATEAQNEAIALAQQQEHEQEQAQHDRAHEVAMAAMSHQNAQQAQATGSVLGEAAPEAPAGPPAGSEAPE